jgi:hypothetical protein
MPQSASTQPPTAPDPIPEMVGATTAPFFIAQGETRVSIQVHRPTGPASVQDPAHPRQVFLRVENVTCQQRAPSFRVYLNVPAGEIPEDHPDLAAGNMGTFGLQESSDPERPHGGNGMNFNFEISALFTRLATKPDWDTGKLTVSFVHAWWAGQVPQVRVGRVSLYVQ